MGYVRSRICQHWSFVPPSKVEALTNENPVDYFIGMGP